MISSVRRHFFRECEEEENSSSRRGDSGVFVRTIIEPFILIHNAKCDI